MLVTLPNFWIAILNTVAWPIIQLSVAYLITQLAWQGFRPSDWLYRQRAVETKLWYEKLFRVRSWKDRLPDGASWFDAGFPKAHIKSRDQDYLKRFIHETCRGEMAHWVGFIFMPIFFIWNPWWAAVIMVVFGILINAPCIVVQRYNRLRLVHLVNACATTPCVAKVS